MNRHATPVLLTTLLLAAWSCAGPPQVTTTAPPSELKAHVAWLADDAREGRRAGTAGELAAAQYIAAQMEQAGLQPGGPDGSWFQEFEIPLPPAPGAVSLRVAGQPVAGAGTIAAAKSGSAKGTLVSVGYGTVLPSHGMDAFADAQVEGCIVLVRRYSEFGHEPPPEMASLSSLRGKIRAAADAGAVGVILGAHPDDVTEGGDPEIEFASVPGSMPVPVVTLPPDAFAALEARCVAAADGAGGEAELSVEVLQPTARARNVLGLAPGSGPDVLLVGAHFDHLGWGGEGSLAPGVHAVHNGADDNASGIAVLLEVAEEWGMSPIGMHPREIGVLFAAWSAEELGLLGSAHWVAQPTVPLEHVLANINLDMVGRPNEGRITVGSASTADGFASALAEVQDDLQRAGMALQLQISEGELPGGGGSDHMSFHKVEIPALFFFSGLHADYHKPSDDTEKLDFRSMSELTYAVSDLLAYLQSEAQVGTLAYRKPPAPEEPGGGREVRAAAVWFGSIPDYGANPEGGGMQLAGTSPGGPAEKAGLKAGDILKRVGERDIVDIYDFMDSLSAFRTGDTVTVHFLRDGKAEQVELTFFPRPSAEF